MVISAGVGRVLVKLQVQRCEIASFVEALSEMHIPLQRVAFQ